MGERSREVGKVGEDRDGEKGGSPGRDDDDQKRNVHRQGVCGDAGKGIVGIKKDEGEKGQRRGPAPPGRQPRGDLGKAIGETRLSESFRHSYHPSVPDKDVPGLAFPHQVLPIDDAKEEEQGDSEKGNDGIVNAVKAVGGRPEQSSQDKGDEHGLLRQAGWSHSGELARGKGRRGGGLLDLWREKPIDQPARDEEGEDAGHDSPEHPGGIVEIDACLLAGQSLNNQVTGLPRQEGSADDDLTLVDKDHQEGSQPAGSGTRMGIVLFGEASGNREGDAAAAGSIRGNDGGEEGVGPHQGEAEPKGAPTKPTNEVESDASPEPGLDHPARHEEGGEDQPDDGVRKPGQE